MNRNDLHYKVLAVTCIFWIIAKVMSWQVWLLERPVPIMPTFEILGTVAGWVHLLVFNISVSVLALLIWRPDRLLLGILVFSELLSCLLDQTRWQPWEYQYLFMAFIFLLTHKRPKQLLSLLAFVICSTYFYSGFAKLNVGFLDTIWKDTILMRFFHLPDYFVQHQIIKYAGILLPLTEFICGIGLLFFKTRKISANILIAMHVFILCLIGPTGINHNSIVWPWNIAMIIFLDLLFRPGEPVFIISPTLDLRNALVFLFWGILPACSYVGYWEKYLSSNLYSGESKDLLVSKEKCSDTFPDALSMYQIYDKFKISTCGQVFSVNNWYIKQINVPCYPEERIYRKLKILIQNKCDSQKIHFFVRRKNVEVF